MNTLQERMLEAIKNERRYDGIHDHFYIEQAAESCAEISKLDAIAVLEFSKNFSYSNHRGTWVKVITGETFTEEELYSLYQTQQNER